ncbi:TlpA family protein disulfide reductase [Microbacterium sp. No. 7]|uniref:TlpA family protein disulfide reductase n=1 Tax=Microbacterium sp. No. 7 TaxID=1714373 RepID=UPI0006D1980A|nr:thioredoxin family protein [Microbacterium sp. No. 7]ALJ21055.1 thiol-disulfide isomerase [Microbacterium sp. No. 7]
MSLPLALAVALGLVVLTTALGLVLRARTGRARDAGELLLDSADLPGGAGARGTLVQFSSVQCARCPQVRRQLTAVADASDGVAHVEIDLTDRPDLAARYRVLQTPTTFVVGPDRRVRARFGGPPRPDELAAAVAAL